MTIRETAGKSDVECAILTDTEHNSVVLKIAVIGKQIFLTTCQVVVASNEEYVLKTLAEVVVSWHEFVNLLYAIQEVSQ